MKIRAFMVVRNEIDILAWTVLHLKAQGLEVYVIDNWSDDGTYEILPDLGLMGFERWPAKPDAIRDHAGAVQRVEQLAVASGADWCYFHDADEIRRSCWPGVNLAEAIARVDARGYTVIDHRVYVFHPIDDSYRGDPESYFRYYTADDPACAIRHPKGWKNIRRVKILGGGHRLSFAGMRIYPEKFALKHYPYRTQLQATAKVRNFQARYSPDDKRMGWGVHKLGLGPNHNFIRDPATLMYWRDPQSPFPT